MKTPLLMLAATTLAAWPLSAKKTELVRLWETDDSLKVPEGVHLDDDRQVLYVSNIDGREPWGRDGAGSLARVSLEGEVLDAEWVTGLHAPKGIARHDDRLYVADLDRVVVVDLDQGRVRESIPVAGAKRLNDVSAAEDGTIYVTDSETGRVHRLKDGKASPLKHTFKSPNGVLASDGEVYVLDQETLYRLDGDGDAERVLGGLAGHVDGVEQDGDAFVVTCWEGRIYRGQPGGEAELLLDTRDQEVNAADPAFDAEERILYVPTFWKNTVVAYRLQDAR